MWVWVCLYVCGLLCVCFKLLLFVIDCLVVVCGGVVLLCLGLLICGFDGFVFMLFWLL